MAGNYPDPSSWRMALDRDGSQITYGSESGAVANLSAGSLITAGDDSSATTVNLTFGGGDEVIFIAVIFPELRDIDGYAVFTTASPDWVVQTSTNTTNGQDGTWTTINASYDPPNNTSAWRTAYTSGTALAVLAIRFYYANGISSVTLGSIHLYGEPAPGTNPDRLVFWDAATDNKMPPATLDWGNVPRSSSDDRTVRVKNLSATKTAANVRVSFDILIDGSPSVPGQHLVSYGGGAFLSQVNIGTLAPGAISGPITVRRVTPSSAQLGLFAPRISAVADTFA
jgi:hypothetical protein